MKSSAPPRTQQLVTASLGIVLSAIVGAVLILGARAAIEMSAHVATLRSTSTLQSYPDALARALTSLRDRLEVRAYTGQVFTDLRASHEHFDHELRELCAADCGGSRTLHDALLLWKEYAQVMNPVVAFAAQPYAESDALGSGLSPAGRTYYADVRRAQLFARENAPRLQGLLAEAAAALQREVAAGALRLRLLGFAGVLATFGLAAVAAYLLITGARHERAAREARAMLQAAQEGFFLLDADLRIGALWSAAAARMFGRKNLTGVAFAELLQGLVPAATLATAATHIKRLWDEGALANLAPSADPLDELEVQVDNGRGTRDTRYLQFALHPLLGENRRKHVLVGVGDVTSSVLLARELAAARHNANSQVDVLLGVMQSEPLALAEFLDASEGGLQLVNTILRDPARADDEFRVKLDGLLRELRAIKDAASDFNLASVAHRSQAFEDLVSQLKERSELSGSDFLPLVLKLDELLAHLHSIRELVMRVAALRSAAAADALQAQALQATDERGVLPADDLAAMLQGLASRLAHEQHKEFRLSLHGLAQIPLPYRATLRDVLTQMLRNSAVHGIEPAAVRRAHGKDQVGLVRAEFRADAAGYELVFEDDGTGLALEELKAAAIKKQLTTAAEAARMDTRAAMGLMFRAGVTTCERVTMSGGRGVGMDMVARGIAAFDGKIVLSTAPGKFTRFKIALPAMQSAESAVA